ncbi:MAG: rhomboid family intramembrane serine protease [Candidatus Aenigmatarchaeota archaeon]
MKLRSFFYEERAKTTYLLISICMGVFLLELYYQLFFGKEVLNEILYSLGFSGFNFFQGNIWTFFTSIFLHANPQHLILNMIALFFFGKVVEEELGWKKFLLIFFASSILGDIAILFSIFMGWMPFTIPTIGASAAIFGLMGAAMLVKPLEFVFYPYLIPIPLIIVAFLYILYNIAAFFIILTTGAISNISYVSHIGGLAMGIFFGFKEVGKTRSLIILLFILGLLIAVPFIWFLFDYLDILNYITRITGMFK